MKHLTQHLRSIGVLTFVVALAAATIPMSKPTQAQAGSAPVTVVNTPLPVNLTGTGTITGNVNAAQSGAWSVGVTSLPLVHLAPGTTVGINGGFSNTATSPIFVRDVDERAKNAYVVGLCASSSSSSSCPAITIPVGTRYVIEYVAGECNVGSESSIDGFKLTAQIGGADHFYYFNDKIEAGSGDITLGAFDHLTRIYADGGVADGVSATIFGAGGEHAAGVCNISLSGYLVSMTP